MHIIKYDFIVLKLGTPQELTNEQGEMVWLNYEFAWGGTYQSYYKEQSINGIVIDKDELQPLKFQGQYYDSETSLHYNRFRYYDSDVGMFIQRDPIGLLGGLNTFQYAPNPIHWIDPWWLANELCVFGNKTQPKGIRDKDLMPDENGILPSQADALKPKGKSATRTPETSGLKGHYHKIDSDIEMPEGLGIKHDGIDMPGGYMSSGHSTIYPTRDVTQAEFDQKLLSLPWSYGGKIE